jgi:hypothetical protein
VAGKFGLSTRAARQATEEGCDEGEAARERADAGS